MNAKTDANYANPIHRRAFLLGSTSALALAACSIDINVELPRIQKIAGDFGAWLLKRFGKWAMSLIKPVLDKVAQIQALKPADGWGPVLRLLVGDLVSLARVALRAVAAVVPIPSPIVAIAGRVLEALEAWLTAPPAVAGRVAAIAGPGMGLDDAEAALLLLGQDE